MLRLYFLLLVNVSLIGTGCGVVGMWGICSPISFPIRSPDKAFGTRAEEEEVSGFTAGQLPVEHGPMWTGVICPPWTPALSPYSPTKSLPETGSSLWGWHPVKVWPLCLYRESQWNKALGLPMGASVYNIYTKCVWVCVCYTPALRPLLQRLSLEGISAHSPCSSLWVSLAWSEKGWSGYFQMCVYSKWHALCCSANTQSKRRCCPPAHPAALVFTYSYLLSSPLFPLSLSKLLEKLAEVFIFYLSVKSL